MFEVEFLQLCHYLAEIVIRRRCEMEPPTRAQIFSVPLTSCARRMSWWIPTMAA